MLVNLFYLHVSVALVPFLLLLQNPRTRELWERGAFDSSEFHAIVYHWRKSRNLKQHTALHPLSKTQSCIYHTHESRQFVYFRIPLLMSPSLEVESATSVKIILHGYAHKQPDLDNPSLRL